MYEYIIQKRLRKAYPTLTDLQANISEYYRLLRSTNRLSCSAVERAVIVHLWQVSGSDEYLVFDATVEGANSFRKLCRVMRKAVAQEYGHTIGEILAISKEVN